MIEDTVLSLSYGRIVVKPPEKLHGLVPESFETYQVVGPGDIIIRPTDLQNDWNTIRVAIARDRGIITSAYICLRTREPLHSDYAHLLLLGYDLKKVFYGMGSGLRQNLDWSDFKRLPVLLPPPEEQKIIVAFVDQIDRHVRRFIRNRRRLIELLNEQKRAIINRAVTRGLDPNVPLKPSGIDWLGDIPEHWQSLRLGRLIDLLTGFPFKSSGFTEAPTDMRLLRGINVSPGRIRWDSVVRWPESEAGELSAFALREADIVFGMDRPVISGGIRVAMVTGTDVPSLLLQRVARLRAHAELDQQYLLMLLQDRRYADYLAPIFTGISVPHISPAQISNYRVALPPAHEQTAIVEHVVEKTRDVDAAIDRAEREMELIREYRTRLIADVVTGNLDVRHLAPPPEAMEADAEPLDQDEGIDDEDMLVDDDPELVEEAADADD